MKRELKKITLCNDACFKSIFRSIEARELVSMFISKITDIDEKLIKNAEYQGGELPKTYIKEKGKISDIIIKVKDEYIIVLEMNGFWKENIFEKNDSYAFKIISESIKIKASKYPKVILINIDNFNMFKTKKCILDFKIRDRSELIETKIYHSIHLILENIVNIKYNKNVNKEIIKTCELMKLDDIAKMKEKYKGDDKYMKTIEKMEDLTKDENLIGYYDYEEKIQRDLIDQWNGGVNKGIKSSKLEIAKNMLRKEIDLNTIMDCTGLNKNQIKQL